MLKKMDWHASSRKWHGKIAVSKNVIFKYSKGPKYDFWISQGSVATVFGYGSGINYSHLRQISSCCSVPKIINDS